MRGGPGRRTIGGVIGEVEMKTTPSARREPLHEHAARLVCSHGNAWPPRHSSSTHAAIAQLIARVEGLEDAVAAVALAVEKLQEPPSRGDC
jgi:hypothetical protein